MTKNWVCGLNDDPIHRRARRQAHFHGPVCAQHSRSVDTSYPLDLPALRHRLETYLTDLAAQRLTPTAEAIIQSYGQRLTPLGPFVYRLYVTSAQYCIQNATEHGTTDITDMISSPIIPPISPDFLNSEDEATNQVK